MSDAGLAAGANARRFDAIASTWDENPRNTRLARVVASAILQTVPIRPRARALEFGCGTGLVTALLAPSLGRVVAADNSAGMLQVLSDKLEALQISNVKVQKVDLEQRIPSGPFDLVFSSMTLHHIPDVAALFQRMHQVVRPGGWVALADLATEDGSFHAAGTPGVMHLGFETLDLVHWLDEAGFVASIAKPIHTVRKPSADGAEHEYPILLATAQRPPGKGSRGRLGA